jgi:hypothetical protein
MGVPALVSWVVMTQMEAKVGFLEGRLFGKFQNAKRRQQ